MNRALLSLGSNVGKRRATLDQAIQLLAETPHVRVVEHSAFYATTPVGGPTGQGEFLNGAAIIETTLESRELLAELQRIEQTLGRVRHERWDARTIDLDLLLYGKERIRTPELILPHPRMSFRPFVLAPACDIAGEWEHPVLEATLQQLLQQLRLGGESLLIVGGKIRERKSWAQQIQRQAPQFISVEEHLPLPAIEMHRSFPLGKPSRLLISLDESYLPGIPRLTLADCDPAQFAAEIDAAIECVWPTGG